MRGLGGKEEGAGEQMFPPPLLHTLDLLSKKNVLSASYQLHKVWGLLSLQEGKMMEPKYTFKTLL